ncbi:MAG TPA: PASTA domain-containing protein [Longimicrobium sp.]
MHIRSTARRLPALLAFALLAAAAALTVPGPARAQDITAARRLQVPNVVGRTLDEATAVLARAGIKVAGTETVTASAPGGTVVRQSPGAGSVVPAGTTATLFVSSGQRDPQQEGQDTASRPRLVTVPPLVGQSLRTADVALALLGLRRGQVDSVDSQARPGRIVTQEPAAGARVPRGTPVRLTLARAAAQQAVAVPDLDGRTVDEAEALLARVKLVLGPIDSLDSGRPEGQVVRQRPAAGTEVAPGSRVGVSVARSALVRVPAVTGQPLARAGAMLREAGLRAAGPDTVTARGEPGTVVRQSVAAGELVRPGTAVRLSVAQGLVRVPNLAGRPLDEAGALLRRARLARGAVDSAGSDRAAGTVVRQSPAAGAEVAPGTAVRLTLAQGRVRVPDLAGRPLDEAGALLRQARLARGAVDSAGSDRAEGTVVGQSPAAGAEVAPGTAVALTLAQPRLVLVPDVVGDPAAAAARDLEAAGLRAGGVDTVESTDAAETVVRQSPAAGTRVRAGTVFTLGVSRGPDLAVVDTLGGDTLPPDGLDTVRPGPTVPNLVGRTLAEARAALAPLGLSAGVDPALGDSAKWLVASQAPPAGTAAARGTAVRLELRAPPPPAAGRGERRAPWPWIVLGALVAGALLAIRLLRKRPPAAPPGPAAPATVKVPPVVRTRGEWDPGAPEVEVAGKLLGGFEVTLGAAADAGEQTVETMREGALIAAEEAE